MNPARRLESDERTQILFSGLSPNRARMKLVETGVFLTLAVLAFAMLLTFFRLHATGCESLQKLIEFHVQSTADMPIVSVSNLATDDLRIEHVKVSCACLRIMQHNFILKSGVVSDLVDLREAATKPRSDYCLVLISDTGESACYKFCFP